MGPKTFCDKCVNLGNPKDYPSRWYCKRFPMADGIGHLSETYRAENPFMLCKGINGGYCPEYEEKREGEKNE
jgi:hypothetical protein